MPTIPRRRSSLWQKTVGLFVTWQLVFLVSTNLLAFLPLAEADDDELTDSRSSPESTAQDDRFLALQVVNKSLLDWARATGQVQAWWLFAPSFPTKATFPVVTLHWDHGQSADVQICSAQKPADPANYLCLPGSQDRLFHYEMRLGLVATWVDENNLIEFGTEWRDLFKQRVRRQWKSMRAYMRWKAETFAKEHPDLPPPDAIALSIEIYNSPTPGKLPPTWATPLELPMARWLRVQDEGDDRLPLDFYDPVRKSFIPLAAKE